MTFTFKKIALNPDGFLNDTVQRRRSQHARTLIPMNTHTQTLPLWAPPNDWAPTYLEIPEVTNG
jgi:hypothetical protein